MKGCRLKSSKEKMKHNTERLHGAGAGKTSPVKRTRPEKSGVPWEKEKEVCTAQKSRQTWEWEKEKTLSRRSALARENEELPDGKSD